MTLITAIIVGLGVGYIVGIGRKAIGIFTVVFLVVLAFQSFILPLMPGPHNINLHEAGYWLSQPAIFALGLALMWVGAKIKEKRSPHLHTADIGR